MRRVLFICSSLMCSVFVGGCDDSGDDPGTDGAAGEPFDMFLGDAYVEPDGPPPAATCLTDDECDETQYCLLADDAITGTCVLGCRFEPDNCGEQLFCGPDHRCEVDPTCQADNDCSGDEYCDDGDCTRGCRVGDFDTCAPLEDGRATECDPNARECTLVVICCGANNACTERLPSDCQDAIPDARFCVNPNPCVDRCRNDDGCADDEYCDATGHCETGCRVEDRRACPGETCDAESRRCAPIPCARDEVCPEGQFCELSANICVLGCRLNPDTCPEGSFCNQARQCVEGCTEDEQCVARSGEGWACVRGLCEPPCMGDGDCDNGELCLANRCELGCRDDNLEQNDARPDALALRFVGERFDSPALVACPQDADWYTFETPGPGWNIAIAVDFVHANGDIDLRVHGPDGQVHRSTSATDNEAVTILDAAPGTYAIEIYSRGVDQNTYDFGIVLTPSGACAPDAAEPGDNVVGGATPLALPGLQAETVVRERTVCGGDADADWFSMALGAGDGVRVELTMLGVAPQAPGELDFAIFGPGAPGDGAMPAFIPNGGGGGGGAPPFVFFEAPRANPQVRAGTYFIRVGGVAANQTGRYLLTVRLDRARPLCEVDANEPNETAERATDLMLVPDFTRDAVDGGRELRPLVDLSVDRWLCEADEDWYRFELREGDDLDVALRRQEPIAGIASVELRNAAGEVVASGRNNRALNVARGSALPAGIYRVRISGEAGVQAQYRLQLNRMPGLQVCTPDRFEAGAGNNTPGTSVQVLPGLADDLTLCQGDTDYYEIILDDAADLTVDLRFSHQQANLDLDIFRGVNEVAENADSPAGHSQDDNERVVLLNRVPGRYVIGVRAVGDGSALYTLEIGVANRNFVCQDDPDEPNGTIDRATDLGAGVVERRAQWLCQRVPAESDFFEVRVPANQLRTIAADFLYGDDGDLVLDAFDDEGQPVASTGGVTRGSSKQCLVVEPHIGDRSVFVRVQPLAINNIVQQDERLDYRMRVLVGDVCDDILPAAPGVVWPRVPAPF